MDEKRKKGRWAGLLSIALGNTLDNADGGLVNILFPVLRQSLRLQLPALGLLTAIGRLSRMLFGPLWAMAADKWNRKTIFVIVTGVWGVWTVLAGFARSFEQFLVLYAIGSIGTVAAEPIAGSIAADLFARTERGKAFGVLRAITGMGTVVLIPVMGSFTKQPEGWRPALFLMGGLSVLSGLMTLALLKEPARGASEDGANGIGEGPVEGPPAFHWRAAFRLFRIKTFLFLGISQFFFTSVVLGFFAVTFLTDVAGFTNRAGSHVLAVFAAGFAISSVFGGMLGDLCDRRDPRKGRIVLMQAFLLLYALMAFLCTQIDWPRALYYPLFFAFGLVGSIGYSGVVLPMASSIVPPELRSSAFGFLFSFIQGGAMALLAVGTGFLAERIGLRAAFLWVGVLPYALNFCLWFVFYKHYPADSRAPHGRVSASR